MRGHRRTGNRSRPCPPGDGKFDQTFLPSDVDVVIGRVDLSRLPAFSMLEEDLLARYLDKDHAWRRGQVTAEMRGLIDDNVGDSYGFAPASYAWRGFAGMFGAQNIHAVDYLPTLETESYLWSYGCGGSSYNHCGGVASTQDFATRTVRTVFTSLYGSYFGDWDNEDNVLRAPLAAEGFTLTNMWSGHPVWHRRPMALGRTIGDCARLTQNDVNDYMAGDGNRQVYIALMGDPTLRMQVVPPVEDLLLTPAPGGGIDVAWSPRPVPVDGYFVYRSDHLGGSFELLTPEPVTATTFRDGAPLPGTNVFMVRALRSETSASGVYGNLSCGVIDSLAVSAAHGQPFDQGRGLHLCARGSWPKEAGSCSWSDLDWQATGRHRRAAVASVAKAQSHLTIWQSLTLPPSFCACQLNKCSVRCPRCRIGRRAKASRDLRKMAVPPAVPPRVGPRFRRRF